VRGADYAALLPRVAEIVADVRARGDVALRELSERFGDGPLGDIRVSKKQLDSAEIDGETLSAIRTLADRVRAFHEMERPHGFTLEPVPGVQTERRFVPIESVGIYVPGGATPLPSSLVMAAIPALAAGVHRIAVASPRPSDVTLATARELGITEVYAMGGAQAIAALAYGTHTVRSVDKIVGPGQAWTAAAKLLVSGVVGIDLPAGPSEVMIIADETADPVLCAADLLAEAEHAAAEAILVTSSQALADAVRLLLGDVANVTIEVVGQIEEAFMRANAYAPEHLQLLIAEPEDKLKWCLNMGAVFLGPNAPAVIGDYAVGTNHVLPTGGLARAYGGLGIEAFLKPIEIVRATRDGLDALRPVVAALSAIEGLPLHGAAVEARFQPR
jgi:histidinol dehydrogenase